MGSCQICTRAQNCTKTLLHGFFLLIFFVYYCFYVTANPYPWSVFFFNLNCLTFFFLLIYFFTITRVTLLPYLQSVVFVFFYLYFSYLSTKNIGESLQSRSPDFRLPWAKLKFNKRVDHANSIIRPQVSVDWDRFRPY